MLSFFFKFKIIAKYHVMPSQLAQNQENTTGCQCKNLTSATCYAPRISLELYRHTQSTRRPSAPLVF